MKTLNRLLPMVITSIFLLVSTIDNAAFAQSNETAPMPVEVPQALGPESIQALVSKLDEKQTSALVELIGLLKSSADTDQASVAIEGQGALETIKGWFSTFAASLETNLQSFPQMLTDLGATVAVIFQEREAGGNLKFLFLLAMAIGVGMAAEWLFNRSSAKKRKEIRESRPEGLLAVLRVLLARAGIEIGGVIVFAVVALITANLIVSSNDDLFLISAFIVNAIVIVRIIAAILHFVLAPRRSELRLVHTDTWTAKFIERNFVMLTAVLGVALFLVAVMQRSGIASIDNLRFWLGMSLHLWIIFVILKARHGLTRIIVGGDEDLTPGLKRMATWWPGLSAAIIAFNWCFVQFVLSSGHEELSPQRSALAIVLIILAPFLDTIVRSIAGEFAPASEGQGDVADKARLETRRSYIRIGRILLLGLLVLVVGKLWGVSLRNLAEAGLGAQVAANFLGSLLILALGYLAWEITNLWINKRLAQEMPETEGDAESGAEGGTGQTRMATILPIMRMTMQVTIIVMTVLLALSQLGVNIAPLLAGAGVLGLAIGFGAQTLVKDVVSGVFFLLDDAFRVGEFITIGTTMGIVEKISIRSLHLRSDLGPVHIVPYGSMSQLSNNSRDWVTMKLRFTVPFDTDLEKVRKIFKKIGQEMLEVPELAEVMINPFKSQGAADVTDVGIVVRGKFTTVPGGQFLIRKEAYTRVQKAFEANGIEFARKEVRIQMPENLEPAILSEEQKKAISAAASEASEVDNQAAPSIPDR